MLASLAFILLTSSAGASAPPPRAVVARVEQRLLAPCCYSQPVGEHMSAEAAEMRREIEDLAASGNSEAAIIAHYKTQYGERILVIPDGGTGRVLFILPPIADYGAGEPTLPPSPSRRRWLDLSFYRGRAW